MPDSNAPPSSRLSQLPSSGGGGTGLVLAAVVLLGAIGGIVYWKTRPSPEPTPPPVVSATPPAPKPSVTLAEAPPPPPPVEDASAPEAAAPKSAGGGGPSPCSGTCKGEATGALTSALSARAGAARGCYERALRVNSMLQGRLVVNVRVDPYGSVCGVSLAQDGVHSPEVSSCVLGMFRGAKFPAPSGGCVDVNVPMSFVPREGK